MNYYVSAIELSKILGLSDRRVRQLAADGVLTKCDDGTYELKVAVEQYYTFKLDTGSESFEAEKAKHEVIKCKLSELKLRKAEGELTDLNYVMDVMSGVATEVRTQMLALPQRVAPKLVNKTSIAQIASILRDDICTVLTYLADIDKSSFLGGDYESAEADESDAGSMDPAKTSEEISSE